MLVGASTDGMPDGTRPELDKAHQDGLTHFSAHLLTVQMTSAPDVAPLVLCRRRLVDEARYPGMLTTTVGGHIEVGLSPAEALRRGAARHGITVGPLNYLGVFEVFDEDEKEVCTVWTGSVDTSSSTALHEWIDVAHVTPATGTPHLVAALHVWRNRRDR